MAYAVTNPPLKVAGGLTTRSLWMYYSTDIMGDVDAVGYFTNGYELGMRVGDFILVGDTTTPLGWLARVITSTAGGASTVSGGTSIT